MSENFNIEEWYKNELSNYKPIPDKKGWESVTNKLNTDEQFENWLKEEINKIERNPEKKVWARLDAKLDIANVWNSLNKSLNNYYFFIKWRNVLLKGLSVALLFLGTYATYVSILNKEIQSTFTNNNNNNNNIVASFTQQQARSNKLVKTQKNNFNNNGQKNSQLLASRNQFIKIEPLNNIIHYNFNKTSIKQQLDTTKKSGIDQSKLFMFFEDDYFVKKKRDKILFNSNRFSANFIYSLYRNKFYSGITASLKHNGALFQSKKELVKSNRLNPGLAYGGTFGIILSEHLNVETNIYISNTKGSKNVIKSEGNEIEETIKTNYSSINILAKKMFHKSTFDNKRYSYNIIGGLYLSSLNSASITTNNNNKDISTSFVNYDLGIVTGIERDQYLTKELILTTGVKFNQGFINTSNYQDYNALYNSSLELNLGIKYVFLKK